MAAGRCACSPPTPLPIPTPLCAFRRANRALLTESFVQVLQLAQPLQVLQFGQLTVATDGTKVLAHASKHRAVRCQRAGERIEQLELEVRPLLAKAEQADATPLQAGESVAGMDAGLPGLQPQAACR